MIAILSVLATFAPAAQGETPRAVRGVWIGKDERELRTSPAKIASAMQVIADAGANAVFVPAWTGGETTFPCAALREALGAQPPERDFLAAMVFEAHRNGLEIFPWFDPGVRCPSDGEFEAAKKHPELFARDESGKLRVADGVAAIDLGASPAQDLVVAVVVEMCTNYDLDGIVGLEPIARVRKEVAAVDLNLVVLALTATPSEAGATVPVLPQLDREGPEKTGDRLVDHARLREKEDEFAFGLRDEAWHDPALLPWRAGKPWRVLVDALDPVAGSGAWNWVAQEGEPGSMTLDGGVSGHVTWRFKPKHAGIYALHVFTPPRDDLTSLASYRLASASGSRTMSLDTSKKKFQGWVRLGEANLAAGQEIELARLTAEEKDATKVTAAGQMVPLLDRRAMRGRK